MDRKDLICSILQAVDEFNRRRLWTRFASYHCFGVRFSDRSDSLLGVVLGAGREQDGLSLFRGPEAAAAVASLARTGVIENEASADCGRLGFSMDRFGNFSQEGQALLREADLDPQSDEQMPSFLVKPAGGAARVMNDPELILLLSVLRAVVKADKKKQLQPAAFDDRGGICVLTLSGDLPEPRVAVAREKWLASEVPGDARAEAPAPREEAEVADAQEVETPAASSPAPVEAPCETLPPEPSPSPEPSSTSADQSTGQTPEPNPSTESPGLSANEPTAQGSEPGSSPEPSGPPADQPPSEPVPPESPGPQVAEGSERPASPFPFDFKVPRNAPCPCGSGRKYKKCCGR